MSLFEDDALDVDRALRETARGISGGGNAVVQGLKTVATGLLGGALGGVLTMPLVLGFGALALGTGALITAFKSATDEATKTSQALASMRASQGLSFNQGYQLTSQNQVLGISSSETAQIFNSPGMNPIIAGLRARALGGESPYSPDAMTKNAQRYQSIAKSGFMGQQRANSWLDGIYGGQAPEKVRLAMNLRPDAIAGNLAYATKIQKGMGVNGEMQRKFAEDIPMAMNRGRFALDTAKVRLAVELAPLLERALTSFATLLANNAPKIAKGIEKLGHFLVQDFPPMVLRAGAWIARGLGNMLLSFSSFTGGLAGNVRPMLKVFDFILNGLRAFGGVVAGFGAALIQAVGTLYNGLKQSGIWGWIQKIGGWLTGNKNSNQTNQVSNQVVGGAAAAIAIKVLGKPVVKGAWAAAKWAGRAAWGAATGAGGAAGAGAGAGGAGAGAAGGGALAAAAPFAIAGAGGIALGVGVYEGWRRTPMGKGLPSTYGIGKYLWAKHQGASEADAARAAYGVQSAATQKKALVQQQRAAAARQRAVTNPSSAFGYNPNLSVGDAFRNGQSGFLGNIGVSDRASDPKLVGDMERIFGGGSKASAAGGQKLMGLADTLDKSADNYSKDIADQLKQIAATTREVAKNTDKGAQSQADLLNNFPDMMRQLVALTSSFIAQDAAMSLLGN